MLLLYTSIHWSCDIYASRKWAGVLCVSAEHGVRCCCLMRAGGKGVGDKVGREPSVHDLFRLWTKAICSNACSVAV